MPGFDGTGPRGQGAGTGWGQGPCGAGFWRGSVRSRGWRFRSGGWGVPPMMSLGGPPRWGYGPWRFRASGAEKPPSYASPWDEAEALREEAAYLQSELEAVQRRLTEIEKA